MIYSYNKNQGKAISSQIYFWNRTLHVSDSSSVHHQQSSTVHIVICICHTGYADCLLARSRSNYSKNKFEKLVLLVDFYYNNSPTCFCLIEHPGGGGGYCLLLQVDKKNRITYFKYKVLYVNKMKII